MDAAKYLLVNQRQKNEKFRQFIVEFFQYHDVSNSLTTLDRRPVYPAGDLHLPDFVPHAQAGALLGIFDGLFHYISETTILRDRIRQRISQGQEQIGRASCRERVEITVGGVTVKKKEYTTIRNKERSDL